MLLYTLHSLKNWHFNQRILKIHIFYLKYKDNNKYVIESPEMVIRKLLSIRIEREKCVKATPHAKNMFFDQKCIFYLHLRMLKTYALASFGFGFRRSKRTRNDKKNSLHTPKPRVCGNPPNDTDSYYLLPIPTQWCPNEHLNSETINIWS